MKSSVPPYSAGGTAIKGGAIKAILKRDPEPDKSGNPNLGSDVEIARGSCNSGWQHRGTLLTTRRGPSSLLIAELPIVTYAGSVKVCGETVWGRQSGTFHATPDRELAGGGVPRRDFFARGHGFVPGSSARVLRTQGYSLPRGCAGRASAFFRRLRPT